MPNYENGKIYCIRSHQTAKVYIGSTTQSLAKRMGEHRAYYKRWISETTKTYYSSYEILQYKDSYVELIELFSCSCKAELHKREGKHIREIDCVNKSVAGRTYKQYYEENKEQVLKTCKAWRDRHKDELKVYFKNYRQENKDYISERRKRHYKENKAKYAAKAKAFREANKQKLSEKSKLYRARTKKQKSDYDKAYRAAGRVKVDCGCGSKIYKYKLKDHYKSIKHKEYYKSINQ